MKTSSFGFVFLFFASTISPLLFGASDEADTLYGQERWREALGKYQHQVRITYLDPRKTTVKPASLFSNLSETESAPLLKAHCQFERGVLAYLKNDDASASKEWISSRETLQAIPKSESPYLRRLNMALAQAWTNTLSTKDLNYFLEGLGEICAVIDGSPLPENSANFRWQIQGEYTLLSARSLVAAFNALNQLPSSENTAKVSAQFAKDLWSQQALCRLIVSEKDADPLSHEALIDSIIFKQGAESVSGLLFLNLRDIWKQLPSASYSCGLAMLALHASESGNGDMISSLLRDDLDPGKLDPLQFGIAIHQVLLTSRTFSQTQRESFVKAIAGKFGDLRWPDPSAQLQVAIIAARAGSPSEALSLMRTLQISQDSPLQPIRATVLTEILYRCGSIDEALSTAEAAIQAYAGTIPSDLIYWQGRCHAKQRRNNEAIKNIAKFLAIAPQSEEAPEASYFLGTLYLSSGKISEAKETFRQTLGSYPGTRYAEESKLFLSTLPGETKPAQK